MTTPTLRRPIMRPLRAWLDTQVSAAVYVASLPKGAAGGVALTAVGLGDDVAALDTRLVQVDCWNDDGAQAEADACAVRQALEHARPGTVLGDEDDRVQLMGADTLSLVSLPDPDRGQPRYVLTMNLTVKAVEA